MNTSASQDLNQHKENQSNHVLNMINKKDQAVERLKEVCEMIITDALTIRKGKVCGGKSVKEEKAANAAVSDFLTGGNYTQVKNHGSELVRSMTALVTQRQMYVDRTGKAKEGELQAMRDTQAYIVDTMTERGWQGTKKPHQWDDCGFIGQMGGGKVPAQISLAARGWKLTNN